MFWKNKKYKVIIEVHQQEDYIYAGRRMPDCDFIKRDGTQCKEPGVRGGTICRRHKNSVGYKICEGVCGKVVSMRHGRPKCTKCDPLNAKRQSDANLKARSEVPVAGLPDGVEHSVKAAHGS